MSRSPMDLIVRLTRVADAAQAYFEGYCQDEAADDAVDWVGCSPEQHKAARELKDALAEYSADEVWAFVTEIGRGVAAIDATNSASRTCDPQDAEKQA